MSRETLERGYENRDSRFPVIPAPAELEAEEGFCRLSTESSVILEEGAAALRMVPSLELSGRDGGEINQPEGCRSVEDLAELWLSPLRNLTGLSLPVRTSLEEASAETPQVILKLSAQKSEPGDTAESYEVRISNDGIVLEADSGAGFFYALQTVIQLGAGAEDGSFPACRICDRPRFAWRGLHLDCGRFFQPSEDIRAFLDLMALHKLNILHWHLTEDQGWRLEIRQYPRLTETGSRRKGTIWGHLAAPGRKEEDGVPHEGFYSREDVEEIVSYARARNIMVVPEIDMPGHSRAAIAAYPELGVTGQSLEVFTRWGVCRDIYNAEESTVEFLRNVLAEVLELFPSPWIHIGGDEAVKDQWKKSPRVQDLIRERGLKDNHEMQSWFIRQMASYLKGRGRRVIGWDEILEGGAPEGAVIMAWRNEQHGVTAAKQGLPVLMTPCRWTYLDYREEKGPYEPVTISSVYSPLKAYSLERVYSWNPLPGGLSEEEKTRIMGGQGQVWTEYMPTPDMVSYMTWPRAAALAEVLWTPGSSRSYAGFRTRLEDHLSLLDRREVPYHLTGPLLSGGSVRLPVGKETEVTVPLSDIEGMEEGTGRIQVLFRRSGWRGYGRIREVRLETADGRVYRDRHDGYAGVFNRLNVYTLGNGRPFGTAGSKMVIRMQACSKIPGRPAGPVHPSRLRWAYRCR